MRSMRFASATLRRAYNPVQITSGTVGWLVVLGQSKRVEEGIKGA
jgi:hypothetical protein